MSGKSRNHMSYVFPMICGSGGSKSRLAKAAGAESQNYTLLRREAHLQVKMLRTTFGSSDVEKLHAAVVRSTSSSQNVWASFGKLHAVVARSKTFGGSDVEKGPGR